jgi:hypothetical protein
MKITQPNVKTIICSSNECLIIPVYQRQYEWDSERWQSLVKDIFDRSKSEKDTEHWIGIILMSRREEQCPQNISAYDHVDTEIIDGQQRILTLRVWLQALFDFAEDIQLDITRPKFAYISCQEMDRIDFANVLNGSWEKHWKNYPKKTSGLMHAYTYFRYLLWLGEDALTETEEFGLPPKSTKKNSSDFDIYSQWQNSIDQANSRIIKNSDNPQDGIIKRSVVPDVNALIETTLKSLTFASVEVEQRDEEPSAIFDALNGQRMELEQFDHVRNFIFRGIPEIEIRKKLYDVDWIIYEKAFEQYKSEIPKKPFNAFMYEYLISLGEAKFQQRISKRNTKVQFVRYFHSTRSSGSHEEVARDSILPAMRNWLSVCVNGKKINIGDNSFELPIKSQRKLFLIQHLSQGPATPLLMNILDRYYSGSMNSDDQDSLYRQISAVESFLARKVIVTTGLQALRSQMMQIAAQLGKDFTETDLITSLNKSRPSDIEVRDALLPTGDVYQTAGKNLYERIAQKSLLSIFQGIESYLSDGLGVDLFQEGENRFTIEHIYPRSWKEWGSDLGTWGVPRDKMHERLDVLGNLTIYPDRVNKELSNHPFAEKVEILLKPEKRIPLLQLNSKFISARRWTHNDIDDRTRDLVNTFLKAYK